MTRETCHVSVIPHNVDPRQLDPTSQTPATYAVKTRAHSRLPFSRSSDPRKDARQCRLTLALPLRGSLVISGSIPSCRYPRVFVNRTRENPRLWTRVRVTLENPRGAVKKTAQVTGPVGNLMTHGRWINMLPNETNAMSAN